MLKRIDSSVSVNKILMFSVLYGLKTELFFSPLLHSCFSSPAFHTVIYAKKGSNYFWGRNLIIASLLIVQLLWGEATCQLPFKVWWQLNSLAFAKLQRLRKWPIDCKYDTKRSIFLIQESRSRLHQVKTSTLLH